MVIVTILSYCQAQPQSQLQLGCSWFYYQLLRPSGKPTLRNSTFQALYHLDLKTKVSYLNVLNLEITSDHNPICSWGHLTLSHPSSHLSRYFTRLVWPWPPNKKILSKWPVPRYIFKPYPYQSWGHSTTLSHQAIWMYTFKA